MKTLNTIALGFAVLALAAGSAIAQSNSTVTKELILKTGTYHSLIQTGAQSSTYTYTLPITTPTANQVLTATGVSGTNVTFGWSSAGGGGGVTYGPASTQNTLTPVTTRLFDVGYASGAGVAAGARIQSGSTDLAATGLTVSAVGATSATGLFVSATGTATNTALGASFTATGGTNNFALIVPASSGNVGIGNSAPGSLLSVGSSGQLTVNTSGNLATSGTVAVTGATLSMGPAVAAPEIRFYEPSGGGSEYSSIKAQAQSATLNYILPATAPAGNDRSLVVSGISGSDVTLKWSTAAMGTSALTLTKVATAQSSSTNVFANVTNMSFSVAANTVYKFEILVAVVRSAGSGGKDVDLSFTYPSGTMTFVRTKVSGASSVAVTVLQGNSPQTSSLSNVTTPFDAYTFVGLLDVGNTGGTFQVEFANNTNSGTVDIVAGSYIIYSN